MTWYVQIVGDSSDLSAIAQSLNGPEINVTHNGKDYVLTSDSFTDGKDAKAIKAKADEMISYLNGGMRIALDSTQSIGVGSVYKQHSDGRRGITVFPDPLVLRARVNAPTVRLTHVDGTVEEYHPADPIKRWTLLAISNKSIADVLKIISLGNLDWINLYKVLEIIAEDVGGLDAISANDWATKTSIKLFKHTANSPGALGLDSRHGAVNTQPPRNPMPISEARAMINSIIHAWLRSKT